MSKMKQIFLAALALLVIAGGVARAADCCPGECCKQHPEQCCHKK